MIVNKEDYLITEDIVRVLIRDENGEHVLYTKYQIDEYREKEITLTEIEKDARAFTNTLKDITVIAENPLNGRMLRFNAFTNNWSIVGTLLGYA